MSAPGYLAASIPPRMAMAGSAVAIPILAVQQMNDVRIGGALVAVSLGPSVLAAPLAGGALHRARRPPPLVFACLAVAGAASPFYMGGLSSFVADVIPGGRRAFAFDALSYNVSAVAGPAFVAIMAVFLPAGAALAVLSATAAAG